jgi:YHS domain-containing protein
MADVTLGLPASLRGAVKYNFLKTHLLRSVNQTRTKERKTKMKNTIRSIAALALLTVSAHAGDLVNVSGPNKVAVSGYDTVAFFTDGKPVSGSPSISAEHLGATYLFATEEHKKLFMENPGKYTPQCGGFCTYGVGAGKLFPVDISTWQGRNGKLYVNKNSDVLKKFNADFDGNVAKANKNWPDLVKKNGK